jgi:non-canonical (house-cleaning) NTP pyrophosphatase
VNGISSESLQMEDSGIIGVETPGSATRESVISSIILLTLSR